MTARRTRRLTAALSAGALVVGLALAGGAPATAETDVPPPLWTATPVTQANIDLAVSRLDGLVADLMQKTGLPGLAVAVVHGDDVLYAKGFGVRNTTTGEPVDKDTVFQLASLSKSVGASVVAGAVGRGIVSWGDPVQKYLPWFTLESPYVGRTVTVGDLYSHRSGLPDHAGDTLEDLGYSRNEILRRLRYLPLSPFRITYDYTNFGLTAAGEAVAVAADTSWGQLSRDLLYTPLGMSSTSSSFAEFRSRTNRADGHVRLADGRWVPRYVRNPDPQSPAGGVSSNVVDLARWMQMEMAGGTYRGERIVAAAPLYEAQSPQIRSSHVNPPAFRSGSYGYGMNVGVDGTGRVRLSHSGAFNQGAGTAYSMLPSERLGIVTLGNGSAIGVPEALNESFMDIVETGEVQRDWLALVTPTFANFYVNPSFLAGKTPPANATPSRPLSAYAGAYRNDFYGTARVVQKNGRLVLELGPAPKPKRYPMTSWGGNLFSYIPTGEQALGISAIRFKVRDGRATSMVVENLENSARTFTR
ncbi:MAG: serine hydrolase [Candidatus Nanopelagicales bacterium]